MKKEMSLYFHINNGGVSAVVEATKFGPMVRMEAGHFGHPTGSVGVYVRREELARLSEFFADAAKHEFTSEYTCAAEPGALYVDGEPKTPREKLSVSGRAQGAAQQ